MWALDTRGIAPEERSRAVNNDSVATMTLIAGLALVLLGAGFGFWLILIGAGVSALGLGGLIRETLARHRSEAGSV
jgi:hypothetical protein